MLLKLDSFVTSSAVENIKRLYADLDEYDQQTLKFAPHYRKGRGDFNCQGIGPCELVWNQCPDTLVLVQKLDLPLSHMRHIVNGRCII